MKINRRKSKIVRIGKIKIGGDNPIAVQSMVKVSTSDSAGVIREIKKLQKLDCKIVRVAVKNKQDVSALKKIKRGISIPLVADIHFDKRLALAAIAAGVDKIRLNPGNIHNKVEVCEIAKAAKRAGIPIRVGVNSGSVKGYPLTAKYKSDNQAHLMVKCALDYIKLLETTGFSDIIVSIKGSDVLTTILANEKIAKVCQYPLHLGVTATGAGKAGIVKSSLAIGRLLSEGIGDTIRTSLTDLSVREVEVSYEILGALGYSNRAPEIISCPTCGRCEVDLIKIVKELDEKLSNLDCNLLVRPVKLAVMGCVVNGPGEAEIADLGVAFGKNDGLLFKKGKAIKKIPYAKCVSTLLKELKTINKN